MKWIIRTDALLQNIYEHPDLGWRSYGPSSSDWGDCDYAGNGQWSSNPTVPLNVWGEDALDINPEFSSPGSYLITGTHPGWTCSGGQCGTSISGGADSIDIHFM